jgi:hypothetical protein
MILVRKPMISWEIRRANFDGTWKAKRASSGFDLERRSGVCCPRYPLSISGDVDADYKGPLSERIAGWSYAKSSLYDKYATFRMPILGLCDLFAITF